MDGLAVAGIWLVVVALVLVVVLPWFNKNEDNESRPVLEPYWFTIWEMQRQQMVISGQPLPERVELTQGTVLYLALTMEELAETAKVIVDAMGVTPLDHEGVLLGSYLDTSATELNQLSSGIRKHLARMQWPVNGVPLTLAQAVELADGVTDSTVTIAGMANASGIPGEDCFDEVTASNYSKASPVSGVIERDASGKWIKGVNYRAPDLLSVLQKSGAV